MNVDATLTLPAPAKLNLFLHITGRRDDGYHMLESVFVPITLADTVTLTRRDDCEVRLIDPPDGLTTENDLACRAARALQLATDAPYGVDIRLTKRIPQGGGLGGGSSDAATVLLGLNRLWKLSQSRAALQSIGAGLGADVPFFVFGQPALATGIGERLLAASMPVCDYVVAFPGIGVATGPVFGSPLLRRDTHPITQPVFATNFGRNDLQPVAERIEPKISQLCADFKAIGLTPRMTGSGACVFAPTSSTEAAESIAARLSECGWQTWVVRSMARHPLFDFA
ncbi:MAG: 4-(cytidine 5'-diphospho)-2-C-methyl-D-erythritol kinase [Burkholderiales bacterium]|nr:4-(cytidine 5'-diphospho)-2-C-methyl-D-erythritol kinase [Burkholderiales bacterium]